MSHHDAFYLAQMVTLLSSINAAIGGGTETVTDRSTTITSGGTSQQLMAANTDRTRFIVQNPSSAIESLFINFTDDATIDSNSLELTPGKEYTGLSQAKITVIAATTGHVVLAKEFSA